MLCVLCSLVKMMHVTSYYHYELPWYCYVNPVKLLTWTQALTCEPLHSWMQMPSIMHVQKIILKQSKNEYRTFLYSSNTFFPFNWYRIVWCDRKTTIGNQPSWTGKFFLLKFRVFSFPTRPTDHQTDIRWHEVIFITNEQKGHANLTILLKIQCFPTEDWGSVCAGLSNFQITKTKQTKEPKGINNFVEESQHL